MATLAILTHSFPFEGGEQFLESEVPFIPNGSTRVVFLPLKTSGTRRAVPPQFVVDESIANGQTRWGLLRAFGQALLSSVFRIEVKTLVYSRKLSVSALGGTLRAVARTYQLARLIEIVSKEYGGFTRVYCYWNDTQAYASVLCKRRGSVGEVVSRAHGFDVYEERRPGRYMPLKRQFIGEMLKVCVVSDGGADYFRGHYVSVPDNVEVSRLGVVAPVSPTAPTGEHSLHVVSISSCTPVKRVEKIIDAVGRVGEIAPECSIRWTHVGGGPLLEALRSHAAVTLHQQPNVTFEMLGQRSHPEVLEFLQTNPVDMFVNTSSSEGIPVSIMEAMSCGIPAVASDVGGVSELVDPQCGRLVSADASVEEIARTVHQFIACSKSDSVRSAARAKVMTSFNAERNYPDFMDHLGLDPEGQFCD